MGIKKNCNLPSLPKVGNRTFFKYLDLVLIALVLAHLIFHIFAVLFYIIDSLTTSNLDPHMLYMLPDNSTSTTDTTSTTRTAVSIIHDDASWSNTVRSLFIAASCALILQLTQATASPGTRGFIIASTIGIDFLSKIGNNVINDPNYVKSHFKNWGVVWKDAVSGSVNVNRDLETQTLLKELVAKVNNPTVPNPPLGCIPSTPSSPTSSSIAVGDSVSNLSNKFLPDGMDDFFNRFASYILNLMGSVFQPVTVNYSNIDLV